MKAAPLKTRPTFPLMKQTDIQNAFHLQMPRWLFTDPTYLPLSLEAKVVYTFLLNRFQLSRLNGWINDAGEVFIIYTRDSLAQEIQLSYHKILDSMKELTAACLIWEKRRGRGDANQIYLARVEHPQLKGGSVPFVPPGHEAAGDAGRQATELDEILENCDLWAFEPETAKVFESAIERLFYSENFRIGGAVLPQAKVRSHLWELDNLKLQAAEGKLHQNTGRQIRNSTAYTMAVVFNTIWESESDLLVDPYLNHLRQLIPRGSGEDGR